MLPVVISDTSPIRYLVLISQVELLRALYREVLLPEAVADELSQPKTPDAVREWISHRPAWLKVMPLTARPGSLSLPDLDAGERDAILLAMDMKADLVLMDEREGVEAARGLGLSVTGTLGVLDRAAELGLIELAPVIARLRQTNFRINPALLDDLLTADVLRKRSL